MRIGPVQFVAVGFETLDRFRGDIIDELEQLTPLGAVRILDVLFVAKEDNGDLVALEMGDLGEEEGDEVLGTLIGMLLGFSFEGEDGKTQVTVDVTESSAIGVSVADIRRIARDLAPGTGAGLLLVEHRWAAGLRDAILAAGGHLIAQGFLTLDGLALMGAELAATADAIEAIEVADALEAEATLQSIEALATIELAEEAEAALVARTIRTLVDTGFIEKGLADEAVAAVVDAALIDRATK